MESFYQFEEEYRDTIGTVDASGKRIWVYPKKPKGTYHSARILVSIILLTLLFAGPFIKVDGHPFILLNIFERKFIIFGQVFWPQDFFLFALAMMILFVFIILFTVIYGRIWCGWACPQTIFMEMVFRKIEYWIEGDANQQRKLAASPWNSGKVIKKGIKHIIFVFISALIGHLLMAYLIGIDQVKEIVSQPPSQHLTGFIGLVVFSGIFYFVFSFFREQACIVVCPYGRLQGVLLVKDSIVVIYDWLRGEPRGKLKKKSVQADKGDCIDCNLCVHACPTGIDIRNGTQMECVNCTACIDACDDVMTKVGKPKGLIRFDSYNGIKEQKKLKLDIKTIGYSIVLMALLGLFSFVLTSRSDIEVTVLRVPGMLYQKQENNRISNLYNIQLINKTFEDIQLEIQMKNIEDAEIRKVGEKEIYVTAGGKAEGTFFIEIPRESLEGTKTKLILQIFSIDNSGGKTARKLIDEVKTNFLGPIVLKK